MYEYKVIPAPLRTAKVKGLKTTAERFAHMMENTVNAEAEEGWEYMRSETLPCEERRGLTGTAKSFQTVLIFRRALSIATHRGEAQPVGGHVPPEAPGERTAWADEAADAPATPEPAEPRASVQAGRQEPVFRVGAPLRAEPSNRSEPTLRARSTDSETTAPEDPR